LNHNWKKYFKLYSLTDLIALNSSGRNLRAELQD